MARQKNDGKGRLGGRKKGTPNRITCSLKAWVRKIIDDNREQFEEDLANLDGPERIKVLSGLLQYVTPKMQSVTPEQILDAEYERLENLLERAPDNTVDLLADKIKQIQDDRKATEN